MNKQYDLIRGIPIKVGGGTTNRWRNDFTGW